jgi:hypothetical protein
MLCEIYVFCTNDLDIDAEFPHEFSDWVDGDPCYRHIGSGLSRQRYTGVTQTRTVTQEGLQGPQDNILTIFEPKYPPCALRGRRCDHTIIAAVENHPQIVVYSIDTVDPDDYDSLPAAMKDMRPDDPIGEELWDKLLTGLVNVTPGQDNKDHVETAMTNWRSDNPEGTARELYLALKRFTS